MGLEDVNIEDKISEMNNQQDSSPETVRETDSEKTPSQAQALLDLSKAEKFTLEGKEMTYEDLKKSLMRQEDYSRKTQELAREREEIRREKEYRENLEADLAKVRTNPNLISEFKKIYPKHYHWVLNHLGNAQEVQGSKRPEVPQEVLERLNRVEEGYSKIEENYTQAEREKFNAKLESIETGMKSKFPYANLTDVYGAADSFFKENGVRPNQVDDKMLEPFFKASHEYQTSQFKAWQKEQLKLTKEANEKASDVGKGGGTPGQAPKKMRLKDVEDEIIARGNF